MKTKRRRGSIMIYTVIALPVLLLVVGLSVDWGRVQVNRVELRRLCDGAARYAVTGVADGTTLAKANWIAGQNGVDGQTVTFAAADVVTGTWSTSSKTFTPGGSSPNAVRVRSQRSVPTMFVGLAGGANKTVAA